MITLAEAVKKHGSRTAFAQVGDMVLFEREEPKGVTAVYLGEVTFELPAMTWRDAQVQVRGVWAYYPDGKSRAYRRRTPFTFAANHFLLPIEERLELVARHFDGRAELMRTWATALRR